jgi:hypothetical protein
MLPTAINYCLQAKELLDHLEDVLSNKPIEVISGNTIVEAKPQGVSKGSLVELICKRDVAVMGATGGAGAAASSLPPASAGAAAVAAHSLGRGGPASGMVWEAAGTAQAGLQVQPLSAQEQEQQQQQQQQQHMQAQPPAAASGASRPPAAPGTAQQQQRFDFVLAIGDDRSDEDMFTAIEQYADTPRHPAEVRCCHNNDRTIRRSSACTQVASMGMLVVASWRVCAASGSAWKVIN